MNHTNFYSIEDEEDDNSRKEREQQQSKTSPNDVDDTLIRYEDVDIERAERQVLKGINFNLKSGEFCYLVGKVGSGKSSLMKTMYADVNICRAGKAEVLGIDIKNIKRGDIPFLRRKIGIVFQDFQLLQDRSVAANLRFVLQATGWKDKNAVEERINEVLKEVGMDNKSYKMPHELSGGEQQRIVIARALLNKPQLILADEPTGNLDPATGKEIVSLLHQLTHNGHSVLMATHNLQLTKEFPARVVTCVDRDLR